jgi:uncharacterized membrane protein
VSAVAESEVTVGALADELHGAGERGPRGGSPLWLIGILLIPTLVALDDLWAARAALLVLLVTLPGILVLRVLRVPAAAVARFPLYVPIVSLALISLVGLGLDLLGPPLGLDRPLREIPLAITFTIVTGALALAASFTPSTLAVRWPASRVSALSLVPLALPLVAAAGAVRLNGGDDATVAVVAGVLAVALVAFGVLAAPRLSSVNLGFLVYGLSLALAWSFALRGSFLYGADIAAEFHVVQSTIDAGAWHPSSSNDAYAAMLSLTTLPASLHGLTGISALDLLKVVYPMVLALFPVGVFALAVRFVPKRWAFVAAALAFVQYFYFQQFPAVARQEIGLIMFLGLMAAVIDDRIPRVNRYILAGLLAISTSLAHYSTAYLAIVIFAAALVVDLIGVPFGRRSRAAGTFLVATLATLATCLVWYGPVTHSSAELGKFSDALSTHGLDLLPSARPGQNVFDAYLNGNAPVRVSADRYEQTVEQRYRDIHYINPLKVADDPAQRRLIDVSLPKTKVVSPGFSVGINDLALVTNQLINLLAIISMLVLLFRRRTSPALRSVAQVGLGALLVLGVIRLSGTAANFYSQERAFLQTLVPLAIGIGATGALIEGRARRLGVVVALGAAGLLSALLINNGGLRTYVAGGNQVVNFTNKGEDYQRFYTTEPEIAAAQWLSVIPAADLLYADRYGQIRVLAAYGHDRPITIDVTPATLDRHAWIYGSHTNVVLGNARGATDRDYTIYRWPRVIGDYFNTVYANGSASVFHR